MSSRSRKLTAAVAALVVLVAAVVAAVVELERPGPAARAECRVALGRSTYVLDLDQATNATTIAAVGKRLGLPDHAVTVAVAAALQESGLHNLDHGDRDSLGLFQQRPSQGWGTPAQVMTPSYAARLFFEHLAQVPGWEGLAVTDAAQRVQRSGAPQAYAQWEGEARAIARATTGEIPAGLACRSDTPRVGTSVDAVNAVLTSELGAPALGTALADARGWTVASWLVGHATRFGIVSVSFQGRTWTPSVGAWRDGTPATADVRVQLARAG
ncbi:MAG TPA: hypothetical protein VFC99_21990 [Acidimicrobiia bacterium]|nr:hypothetical protein [Acidimicrobiia bacterium]